MLTAQFEPEQKGDRHMEAKPAQQNIQDSFLNTARKERHNITIYLVSGVKLTGRIRSFDKYSVVLETSNQEQLIFKHAISTVVISRGAHPHVEGKAATAVSSGEAAAANSASGTEG
jgi:host factor-I protein